MDNSKANTVFTEFTIGFLSTTSEEREKETESKIDFPMSPCRFNLI